MKTILILLAILAYQITSSQNVDKLIGSDYSTIINELTEPDVYYSGSVVKDKHLITTTQILPNSQPFLFSSTILKFSNKGLMSYTLFVVSRDGELIVPLIIIANTQRLYGNKDMENYVNNVAESNKLLELANGYLTTNGNFIEALVTEQKECIYFITHKDYIYESIECAEVFSIRDILILITDIINNNLNFINKSFKISVLRANN